MVSSKQQDQDVFNAAADLAYEFGSLMPAHRFVNVDGTPDNAQVKVRPAELEALLRVAIEVGQEMERKRR